MFMIKVYFENNVIHTASDLNDAYNFILGLIALYSVSADKLCIKTDTLKIFFEEV